MTIGKVHLTKARARFRLLSPKHFMRGRKNWGTQRMGRRGTQRIAGRLKSTGKWMTQSVTMPKKRYLAMSPRIKTALHKQVRGLSAELAKKVRFHKFQMQRAQFRLT